MVKQVTVSPIPTIIPVVQSNDMPLVQLVDPTETSNTTSQATTNNTTINNIVGIQANNIIINTGVTGYPSSTTFNSTSIPVTSPLGIAYDRFGQEVINVGASPNDGEGDPLRVAFQKVNNNFSNLFAASFTTTESITSGITPNQVIFEYPTEFFSQGTIEIRSYNPDTSDMQNITLSAALTNDANNVRFTGYATLFEGNPVCRYDMDVVDQTVRILVNPLINATLYHFMAYQATNVSLSTPPALALDGYPIGSVLGTESDEIITAEG